MGDGERRGRREQMDRMTHDLVRTQNMPVEKAKQVARDCAIRADRRDDKKR